MNRSPAVIAVALGALSLLSTPAHASGVATSDVGPLRAAYTHVAVTVDGGIARTVVTQVFVNDLEVAAEMTYAFPLPGDATVTGFADWRDGRRIEAVAAASDEAADEYERAADEGRPASIAETSGRGGFRMRLSAVPPHGSRRVELAYVQTLTALAGERTWIFPSEHATEGAPPTVLDVDVALVAERAIRDGSVQSLNHPDARRSVDAEGRHVVHLSRAGTGLGRDLVVRWMEETTPLDLAARAVRTSPDEPGYLEARFAFNDDPFSHLRAARDVVIVVDRSLSMAGEPLERGIALAQGVLAELGAADRFGVVMFNEFVVQLSEELMPAEDHALAYAVGALDDIHAGGRSNLQGALDAASDLLADSEGGLVLLIADGEPTVGAGYTRLPLHLDREEWAAHTVLAAQTSYPSRRPALEALLPNISVRYIPDGPAGEEVVEGLIRLAVAPIIEELQISVAGAAISAEHGARPTRLPVGEQVRLLARVDSDAVVLITGRLHGRPVMLSTIVALPRTASSSDRGLPIEWARARVHALEGQLDTADLDAEAREAARVEVRGLGTKYRLATRFTSYVLTDTLAPDRIKPGDPEIRVRAPREALGVRAMLPWGEIVECAWEEDEGLWLGRFLVPRGTPDGMYRMRVFVDGQSETELRGTLFFRVDSDAPELELVLRVDGAALDGAAVDGAGVDEAAVARGDTLLIQAGPAATPDEGGLLAALGSVIPDPIDVKRVVVQIEGTPRALVMERVGLRDLWEARLPIDLEPGSYTLRLIATDYAANSSEATARFEVSP